MLVVGVRPGPGLVGGHQVAVNGLAMDLREEIRKGFVQKVIQGKHAILVWCGTRRRRVLTEAVVPGSPERAADDRLPLQSLESTGDVKDRADLPSLQTRDQPTGLFCWDSDQVNGSARGLRHHLGHERHRAVRPGADDQPGPPHGSDNCVTTLRSRMVGA